jgi:branched-chain amino acid transport system permease protein
MKIHSLEIISGSSLLAVLILFPVILSEYYLGLVIQMMIYALFAMSLDILLGYTGLPSLGHAAYFGIAAYTVGIISLRLGVHPGLALAAGLISTVVMSAIFGLLAIRTHGAYFLMITLALAQVVWGVAFKWHSLTGADDGLSGVPRPSLGIPFSLSNTTNFYFFILVLFVLLTGILCMIVYSSFGRALTGIRESEIRMQALGYNVWLYKYLAFIIAGTFAGLAGILFTYYNGIVNPATLSVVLSAKVLLMVILGGAGTLFGPVLGAGIIVLLENVISAETKRWLFIMGALFVVVLLFAPEGIVGTLKTKLRKQVNR